MNILEYAINMENEGEKYYREQAEMNRGNQLYNVCVMLAEDERKHAEILHKKMDLLPYTLEDADLDAHFDQMFKDMKKFVIEGKQNPSQLDFYRKATDLEKKSIQLYTDLMEKSEDEKEKQLFDYLTKQENKHFELLEALSEMLRNSEEWVENAEFGTRKDY